jgi:anaerobic selenocysteine-containing dehydrogenase
MDSVKGSGLSRRDFLKRLGFGAAAATVACVLPSGGTALASEEPAGPTWGMLIDISRCSGCTSCALAC